MLLISTFKTKKSENINKNEINNEQKSLFKKDKKFVKYFLPDLKKKLINSKIESNKMKIQNIQIF